MSRIRGKHTSPELKVRKFLTQKGFRYRLHYSKAPGKPDIVFPGKKAAIFVNGCFWHQHGCKNSVIPKTNTDFWLEKLQGNVIRDKENIKKLKSEGWHVFVIWECQTEKEFEKYMARLVRFLKS